MKNKGFKPSDFEFAVCISEFLDDKLGLSALVNPVGFFAREGGMADRWDSWPQEVFITELLEKYNLEQECENDFMWEDKNAEPIKGTKNNLIKLLTSIGLVHDAAYQKFIDEHMIGKNPPEAYKRFIVDNF